MPPSADPTATMAITFASTLTQDNFHTQGRSSNELTEQPLLLFDPHEQPPPKRATSPRPHHGKKRRPDHIPRPPNSFMLYRAHFIAKKYIPETVEKNCSQLSKIAAVCWNQLSEFERAIWENRAKAARDEHALKYPNWRFTKGKNQTLKQTETQEATFVNTTVTESEDSPLVTDSRTPKSRRKMTNKPEMDPERAQLIADMLLSGKRGDELEAKVKQDDTKKQRKAGQAPAAKRLKRSGSCISQDTPTPSTSTGSRQGTRKARRTLAACQTMPELAMESQLAATPCPSISRLSKLTHSQPSHVQNFHANQMFSFHPVQSQSSDNVEAIAPHVQIPEKVSDTDWSAEVSSWLNLDLIAPTLSDDSTLSSDASTPPLIESPSPSPLSATSSFSDLNFLDSSAPDGHDPWSTEFQWAAPSFESFGSPGPSPTLPKSVEFQEFTYPQGSVFNTGVETAVENSSAHLASYEKALQSVGQFGGWFPANDNSFAAYPEFSNPSMGSMGDSAATQAYPGDIAASWWSSMPLGQ